MFKIKGYLLILFISLFVVGCVGINPNTAALLSEIAAEDRVANKQIALAKGERTFETSSLVLMKAFITTFAQFNMRVVNLDKELGYILAEGETPISPEKYKELGMRNVDRLNERSSSSAWTYLGSNTEKSITVSIFEKQDNLVTAKMGISNKVLTNAILKINETPPWFTEEIYTSIWTELDKQLFILQGTK
jgi:hypothetical protein